MSPCAKAIGGVRGRISFRLLAEEVLSLNPAIRWVALEEAGREPRWAWHDTATGELCTGTADEGAQLLDPLLFLVAEGPGYLRCGQESADPHRLLFIIVAYADLVQVVARFGRDAHVSVALPPGADAHATGKELIRLLNRHQQGRFVA